MSEEKAKEQKVVNVAKVTMPGGRVAFLREMQIGDNQLAAKMLGKRSGNQLELAIAMQDELLKLLIVKIDDKVLDHKDKNSLKNLLNIKEYKCLMKVLQKIEGEDDLGEEVEMEFTAI